MESLARKVANRYMIRLAVREVVVSRAFCCRTASLQDLTPEVLESFAEGFYLRPGVRIAFLGGITRKLKKLVDLFKKVPKVWQKIKDFLGIEGVLDIPGKIKEWANRGWDALKKIFAQIPKTFPLSLFFVPKNKMPGITDMMSRIVGKVPWLAKIISKIQEKVAPIDEYIEASPILRNLRRPVIAAIFIWIWFQVAELSWDIEGLIAGFTGSMSFGELLASLPESGIGLIAAMFGLGYGALGVTLIARLIYLAAKKYIEWKKGGFIVHWSKMGVNQPDERIPVFA